MGVTVETVFFLRTMYKSYCIRNEINYTNKVKFLPPWDLNQGAMHSSLTNISGIKRMEMILCSHNVYICILGLFEAQYAYTFITSIAIFIFITNLIYCLASFTLYYGCERIKLTK